jgi:CubicO group peptidase (beta-lactamase class C family)
MLKFSIEYRNLAVLCFASAVSSLSWLGCADDGATDDGLADAGLDIPDVPRPDVENDASADADSEPDSAADADTSESIAPNAAALEAIAADLDASNATAASIAIWDGTEVHWLGGFGALPSGAPIDADTLFMIGSDTKKLTAVLILQAVERGELSLDDTVADHLPDLNMQRAPSFPGATLHDLISHQGGIVDGIEATRTSTDAALSDFVYGEFAREAYELAPPGIFFNYSNPNFSIAGLVAELNAATPWADLVVRDVFQKLGMSRSFSRKADLDENIATGVGLDAPDDTTIGAVSLEDTWESAYVRPAGLVWSTPSDMARFAAWLVDGDSNVLGDELRQLLFAPEVPMYPDMPGDYGYGLFLVPGFPLADGYHEVPVITHGGNTWTHTSTFIVFPEQRLAISILSNGLGDDFSGTAAALATQFADFGDPVAQPQPVFDAEQLDGLVGTYIDPNNAGELNISREGDLLVLDAPTLDRFNVSYERQLEPVSTRVWVATVQGEELGFSFIDGPDGETYLANRAIVAVRAPSDKKLEARQIGATSSEQLRAAVSAASEPYLPAFLRIARGRTGGAQ